MIIGRVTEVFNVEDVPIHQYVVTIYEFRGDCVIVFFCSVPQDFFKWCESLESAKEFYNKWKELQK